MASSKNVLLVSLIQGLNWKSPLGSKFEDIDPCARMKYGDLSFLLLLCVWNGCRCVCVGGEEDEDARAGEAEL